MNDKIKKLLESNKGRAIGLFIDNANWFYPQRELGWRISFSKLRVFLEQYYTIIYYRKKIYAGTPLTQEDQTSFDRFKQAAEKSGFSFWKKLGIKFNNKKAPALRLGCQKLLKL